MRGQLKGSFSKGAGTKCLRILNNHVILSKNSGEKEVSKNTSEGSQSKTNLQKEEILRLSAEVLSEHSTTIAQNDKNGRHCGLDPQSQSCANVVNNGQSYSSFARVSSLLNLVENQKLDSQSCRFENDSIISSPKVKKPAFTLAEVLITLGVIGIVAVMTLPMLAKNYQFFIRQQQFKKAYAALNIAVQKTQIDMGEGVRCYHLKDTYKSVHGDCVYFYHNLSETLNTVRVCNRNSFEGGCLSTDMPNPEDVYAETQGGNDKEAAKEFFSQNCKTLSSDFLKKYAPAYVFADFTLIPNAQGVNSPLALSIVDVNGFRGPNKWGHDIFVFELQKPNANDSVFQFVPSQKCHPLNSGGYYTKHFFEYLYGQNSEL